MRTRQNIAKTRMTMLAFALFINLPAVPLKAQYIDLHFERVAHYPFEGDARDISVYQNHGVVSGISSTADRFGQLAGAYAFDGSAHINCGIKLAPLGNAMTLSCWVRTTGSADNSHLVSKYDFSADAGFILSMQDGHAAWGGRDGSGRYVRINATRRIDDGQWHHVLCVVDGEHWLLYIDNALENHFETGYNRTKLYCGTPLTIGMYFQGDDGNQRYFSGDLDDILIYTRVLNDCEREALYTGVFFPQR